MTSPPTIWTHVSAAIPLSSSFWVEVPIPLFSLCSLSAKVSQPAAADEAITHSFISRCPVVLRAHVIYVVGVCDAWGTAVLKAASVQAKRMPVDRYDTGTSRCIWFPSASSVLIMASRFQKKWESRFNSFWYIVLE